MYIELHDHLRHVVRIPATRIIIYDDYDNPIALAVHVEGGQHIVSTVTQPAFKKLLKALGIDKTVIVEGLKPNKLLLAD